jgi:hypothetical protein
MENIYNLRILSYILFRWLYSTLSHSGILSWIAIRRYFQSKYFLPKDVLIKSNHTVGVSIIAPAFNEAMTIVYNVKSSFSRIS